LNVLYVSLAAVGGLLLLLGLLGGLLKERTPVSEPLIALIAGVLIGPAALGLLDLAELGNETLILEEAALLTLGIALVGVALRLPVGYASGNWRLVFVLLQRYSQGLILRPIAGVGEPARRVFCHDGRQRPAYRLR
jgi:sodium/hydrogen antiporter